MEPFAIIDRYPVKRFIKTFHYKMTKCQIKTINPFCTKYKVIIKARVTRIVINKHNIWVNESI